MLVSASRSGVRYFCDASVLAHHGIPSVAFGPGDIAQAHTAEEWIDLESLKMASRMLSSVFRNIALNQNLLVPEVQIRMLDCKAETMAALRLLSDRSTFFAKAAG